MWEAKSSYVPSILKGLRWRQSDRLGKPKVSILFNNTQSTQSDKKARAGKKVSKDMLWLLDLAQEHEKSLTGLTPCCNWICDLERITWTRCGKCAVRSQCLSWQQYSRGNCFLNPLGIVVNIDVFLTIWRTRKTQFLKVLKSPNTQNKYMKWF